MAGTPAGELGRAAALAGAAYAARACRRVSRHGVSAGGGGGGGRGDDCALAARVEGAGDRPGGGRCLAAPQQQRPGPRQEPPGLRRRGQQRQQQRQRPCQQQQQRRHHQPRRQAPGDRCGSSERVCRRGRQLGALPRQPAPPQASPCMAWLLHGSAFAQHRKLLCPGCHCALVLYAVDHLQTYPHIVSAHRADVRTLACHKSLPWTGLVLLP